MFVQLKWFYWLREYSRLFSVFDFNNSPLFGHFISKLRVWPSSIMLFSVTTADVVRWKTTSSVSISCVIRLEDHEVIIYVVVVDFTLLSDPNGYHLASEWPLTDFEKPLEYRTWNEYTENNNQRSKNFLKHRFPGAKI